jgi:hypothetical protein
MVVSSSCGQMASLPLLLLLLLLLVVVVTMLVQL